MKRFEIEREKDCKFLKSLIENKIDYDFMGTLVYLNEKKEKFSFLNDICNHSQDGECDCEGILYYLNSDNERIIHY